MPKTEVTNTEPEVVNDSKPIADKQMFEMVMASLETTDSVNSKITENHISQILKQREKVIDYVHKDKSLDRFDSKFYFIATIISTFILFAGIAKFAPEYLSEVISGLLGVIAGLGGGYGIAKK
jgi:hypothetical protein